MSVGTFVSVAGMHARVEPADVRVPMQVSMVGTVDAISHVTRPISCRTMVEIFFMVDDHVV